MTYVTDNPEVSRKAASVVATVKIPKGIPTYRPGAIREYLAGRGWVPAETMPAVDQVVLVAAYREFRQGVVTSTAKTRATVAVTTPGAIEEGKRRYRPPLVTTVTSPFVDIYVRRA